MRLEYKTGKRYGDYDDFRRDVGEKISCPEDWTVQSGGVDFVVVSTEYCGPYRLSNIQAINVGLGLGEVPITVNPKDSPLSFKTHILYQGSPLCRFTRERPVDWPPGHEWVPVDAYKQGAKITCGACAHAFDHAKL